MFEVGKYRCTCTVGGKCCQNSGKAGQMFVPSRNQIIRSLSLRREIEIEDVVKCCVCKAHRGSSNTTLAVAIESLKQAEVAQAEKEARQAEFVRTQLLGNRADEERKPAPRPHGQKPVIAPAVIVSKQADKVSITKAKNGLEEAQKELAAMIKADPTIDTKGEFQLRHNDLRWLKSQVAAANARARKAEQKARDEKWAREAAVAEAAEAKKKAERDAEKARLAAEAKRIAELEATAKAERDMVDMYAIILGETEKVSLERAEEIHAILTAEATKRGIGLLDLTEENLVEIGLDELTADDDTAEIEFVPTLVVDNSVAA